MFAVETIIGIAAVATIAILVARRSPVEGQACGVPVEMVDPRGPAPDDWCVAIERVGDFAVLAFDGSLRLRAKGRRAGEMFDDSKGAADPHLFDLAPQRGARDLLALMAEARRKGSAEASVEWGDDPMIAQALSLDGVWIALLLRRAREAGDEK